MGTSFIERLCRWRLLVLSKAYTTFLSSQFGELGRGCSISPPFRFANLAQISLGEGIQINRDCWIHVLKSKEEKPDIKLTIKSHTSIGMGATISAAREIIIGEHVLMARNVYISDHGHAFEDVTVPIALQGIRDVRPVLIGDHTWLGQNVCVLPGVQIGKHCVVGANTVINRNLPDFSVAVGSPARIVKRYNSESQVWENVNQSG
jgi:acetyltransferase-like isoleucine patch superfamily enzyme